MPLLFQTKLLLGCLHLFDLSSYGVAVAATQASIHVDLFGNQCLLVGDSSEKMLQNIHKISPAEIPELETEEDCKNFLKAIQDMQSQLPQGLAAYRLKLQNRIEAKLAFLKAFNVKTKKLDSEKFLTDAKRFLTEDQLRILSELVKKQSVSADKIRYQFEDFLPMLPEAEFHETLRALKIEYQCPFEDESEVEADGAADSLGDGSGEVTGSSVGQSNVQNNGAKAISSPGIGTENQMPIPNKSPSTFPVNSNSAQNMVTNALPNATISDSPKATIIPDAAGKGILKK